MAHEAFVSYSENDKETVDAICTALEENAIGCWYAPRDVPIGADWDASILEALAASRVMILVWSTHSDQSKQVKREVALALDEMNVTVIPFRIESIERSNLRFFLSGIQWFDASTPPPEANLKRLVEQVKIAIPMDGQIWIKDYEIKRLLAEIEALQKEQEEAIEEAEAAEFRHNEARPRLVAEVEALRKAAARTRSQIEAEALKQGVADALNRIAAEAAQHAETKARLRTVEKSLRLKVSLKRAEVETARKRR